MKVVKTELKFEKEGDVINEKSNDDLMNDKFIEQSDNYILVEQRGLTSKVVIKNISHLTCEDKLISIHFIIDREAIHVTRPLNRFVEDLKIYGFVFGKRNCLLDITKIKSVNSKNNTVTMKNDENLTISRQKLASLRQLLKKHENHSRS